MKNNADPDQLASDDASWYGSMLFSKDGITFCSCYAHRVCIRLKTLYCMFMYSYMYVNMLGPQGKLATINTCTYPR